MEKITLSVRDVAEVLGVSVATVYTGVSEGEIPHFRIRGKILFNKDVIMEWTRGESIKSLNVE